MDVLSMDLQYAVINPSRTRYEPVIDERLHI